jgi:iron complex transport system substrate-binding protein
VKVSGTTRIKVILLAAICLLAACGAESPGSADASSTPPQSSSPDFPVSFDTRLGNVQVDSAPERVVVLMDDEFVVALGVLPIAMAQNPALSGMSAVVEEALDGQPIPELLDVSAGYPYERIASLQPDLIIGGVTQQDFDQLTKIAPTLNYEESSTTESWQHRQLSIGKALGKVDEAEQLVADTVARVARIAEEARATLNGKSFSFAFAFGQGQVSAMRDSEEAAADLLGEVGLTLADESQALENPDGSGRVTLNLESLDQLAADVVLVAGTDDSLIEQVTGNPSFKAMVEEESATVVILPINLAMQLVRPSALTADTALADFLEAHEDAA